jgi:hypothetical protein
MRMRAILIKNPHPIIKISKLSLNLSRNFGPRNLMSDPVVLRDGVKLTCRTGRVKWIKEWVDNEGRAQGGYWACRVTATAWSSSRKNRQSKVIRDGVTKSFGRKAVKKMATIAIGNVRNGTGKNFS